MTDVQVTPGQTQSYTVESGLPESEMGHRDEPAWPDPHDRSDGSGQV